MRRGSRPPESCCATDRDRRRIGRMGSFVCLRRLPAVRLAAQIPEPRDQQLRDHARPARWSGRSWTGWPRAIVRPPGPAATGAVDAARIDRDVPESADRSPPDELSGPASRARCPSLGRRRALLREHHFRRRTSSGLNRSRALLADVDAALRQIDSSLGAIPAVNPAAAFHLQDIARLLPVMNAVFDAIDADLGRPATVPIPRRPPGAVRSAGRRGERA